MNYVPSADGAFASVEYIMRDVDYAGFFAIYTLQALLHFLSLSIYICSVVLCMVLTRNPEIDLDIRMTIYLILMAEGFMGYVLPWGQMSYWGANVIVSLAGAIPFVGEDLMVWIQGDYLISGATLNRFFALHVIALPLVLVALVFYTCWPCTKSVPIILTVLKSRRIKMPTVFRWMVLLPPLLHSA